MTILPMVVLATFAITSASTSNQPPAQRTQHPIRTVFERLTECVGHSLFRDSGKYAKVDLRNAMRDDTRYWRTGDPDFVNANPNDGRYEVFRAQYDRRRHILALKHDMYEDAEVVVAATSRYSFSNADLSNAIPVKGLHIGETRSQVEHALGRGFRQDRCGKEQYYYYSPAASFLVVTYDSGRLTRFFGGFYTD